jgi:hypothetical protein
VEEENQRVIREQMRRWSYMRKQMRRRIGGE